MTEEFALEVSRRLASYSVAICRWNSNDPKTFRFLGSGVCVVRDGAHGILTAHHCLHACDPEVRFDLGTSEHFLFALWNNRQIAAEPFELREQPLAFPKNGRYGEFGPDLTFIEILPTPRLSSFKAYVSFWNLDRAAEEVRRKFCIESAFLTNVGFPECKSKIEVEGPKIGFTLTHGAYWGTLRKPEIKARRSWDYVQTVCDVRLSHILPETFAGLSGGGIWIV